MYDRTALLAALKHDAACTAHLARQLKPRHLAFRFSPGQRSTIELLRYQTIQIQGIASYLVTGTWDAWDGLEAAVADLDVADIPAALAAQQRVVARLVKNLDDAALAAPVKALSGRRISRGAALADLLACAAAYRMQLFLQAKAAGLKDLSSDDLWRAKRKPAKRQA